MAVQAGGGQGGVDAAAGLARRIEARFVTIATERMAGLPFMNDALEVAVVGLQRWQDQWLGALLTPWFLNLVLLPVAGAAEGEPKPGVGVKSIVGLPAGRFEFIVSHDEELGTFSMSSLFSPVLEFADQVTAMAAAEVALAGVLEVPDDQPEEDVGMIQIWQGELPEFAPSDEPTMRSPAQLSASGVAAGGEPGDAAAHDIGVPSRRRVLFGAAGKRGGL